MMTLAAALTVTNATAATSATAVPGVPDVAVVPAASTNMPPRMASVWQQAQREHRRTADLFASGAIDAAEAVRRRAAIRRAFERVCRFKGLPENEILNWKNKLP